MAKVARKRPPIIDPTRYKLVDFIRVHRDHENYLIIEIYQWVNQNKSIYLQTWNPILKTLEGEQTMMYIYFKSTKSPIS